MAPAPAPATESYSRRTTEFEGGVVLVTGAASGIGQACARLLALNGCGKLFLVDLSRDKLEATARLITQEDGLTPQMELFECNVADEASVQRMVRRCVEVYGRIDMACNNAGVSGKAQRTHEATMDDFDLVSSVNERGVLLCEKYELEQMLGQARGFGHSRGCIVNTASIGGYCIIPNTPAYDASKHAVVAITRCDALRHIQDGVRINCVSPGPVWTPMLSGGSLSDGYVKVAEVMAPMHRYIQPHEVAEAMLFLGGPRASALSGVNLPVDCGNQLIRSM